MDDLAKPSTFDRRTFMRRGAMGAGALWAISLQELSARTAMEAPLGGSPYGPVSPKIDETTGLPLLQLPDGFRYFSYGWQGDKLSDGTRTPALHDGMAVVDLYNTNPDLILLVRNHEVDAATPFTTKPGLTYAASAAGGGTTSLIFDQKRGRFLKAWPSLAGTIRNCAGGVTPWGTWITCEETGVTNAGGTHGWCFDVNPFGGDPTPLTAMGRFSHEAMMVDPTTGYIYETEDNGTSSGFYKFVPNVYSQLKEGGELFMLRVKNQPQLNLGGPLIVGTTWDVEWVKIDNPAASSPTPFAQGLAKGGARFRRLEGAWWGYRKGYFLATEGGGLTEGQVFEYDPFAETLKIIFESADANECDNPDNLTVTPRGGLLLCEDAATGVNVAAERLIGLTLDGVAFTFASNNVNLTTAYNDRVPAGNYRSQEFAGACYSPDGKWLFANIQTPGITFAITGNWGTGPL